MQRSCFLPTLAVLASACLHSPAEAETGLAGLSSASRQAQELTASLVLAPRAGGFAASQVHQPQVLAEVLARVDEELGAGRTPILVFDIDDTLFATTARHLRILRELATESTFAQRFPMETRELLRAQPKDCRYEITDTARSLGVTNAAALEAINAHWQARFFTSEYALEDEPLAGAAAYVRSALSRGATVVYLTGRNRPGMGQGTEESLRRHGFPAPDGATVLLVMKDDATEKDSLYKDRALGEIVDAFGSVVAAFENEPRNLNVFARRYPAAMLIFVDTRHSPAPDLPDASASWVKDFRF